MLRVVMRVEKIKSRNYKKDRTVLQPRYRARTRSVLRGVTTQSVGTIGIYKSASTLIVPIAPRGHASRDAPRHKWHRRRTQ